MSYETKSRSKDSTLRGIARRKSDREKSNRKIATTKSLEFGKELIRTPNEKLTISSFFLLLFHLSTRWRRCQLLFIRLEAKNTTFDDWYYTSVRDPRKTNVQQAKFRKNKRVMWGSKIGGSTRSVTVEKRRIGEGGNNKETEKDWTVLAFDELLLLHQDQRNGTRVAHRLFQLFVHYLDNIQSLQTRSKYTPNNFPIPLRIPSWFHTSSSFRRSLILSTHFLSSLTTRISDHLWGTLSFTIYNNPPCLTVGPRGCYTN